MSLWNPYKGDRAHYERVWNEAKSLEGKDVSVTLANGATLCGRVRQVGATLSGNLDLILDMGSWDKYLGPDQFIAVAALEGVL